MLFKYKGTTNVDFDFCQLGMHYDGYPVKKRTRVLTNSLCIAQRLAKIQCPKDHKHIPLMNGGAGPRQEYPRMFCRQICIGLKEELAQRAIASATMTRHSHRTIGEVTPCALASVAPICAITELLNALEEHPHVDTATMNISTPVRSSGTTSMPNG